MANFSVSYNFRAVDEFSETVKKIGRNISALAAKVETVSKRFKRWGEGMTKVGKSLSLKLTAPLVAAGILSLRVADKFQGSLERMRVTAHLTNSQFEALSAQAKKLGATTDFTASQIVQGQAKMAEVGFNFNQIMKATPPSLTLASAALMDTGEAAEITARIMKGYNFSAKQMNSVNDQLAVIATKTHMDLGELASGIDKVKATTDAAGMSFTDVLSILAAMDEQEIDVRQAMTGLRTALQYLIKPSAEALKFFKAGNIHIRDMKGNLLPLTDILIDFKKKVIPSKLEKEAFLVFGQSGAIMAALMRKGIPAIKKYTAAMKNTGFAAKLANVDMLDFSGAQIRVKRATDLLAISLGNKLTPTVSKLLNIFAKYELNLSNASKGTKQLLGDFVFFGAALGPVILVFGKFLIILALISDKVPIAAVALRGLGLSFRFLWRSVFAPIAIITTLITLFDAAYKHITRFRNAVNETASVLEKVFKRGFGLASPFMAVLGMIVGHIENMHAAMTKVATVHAGGARGTRGGGVTSGISMAQGTSLLRPSILQTAIQHTVKSSLDINVQDPYGHVKSVTGFGDHDMSLNMGQNMAYSRI